MSSTIIQTRGESPGIVETDAKDALASETVLAVEDEEEVTWTETDQNSVDRAIRKLDFTLVPVFGVIFMMSSLDRSNIGNAKLTSFSTDLGLVGNQYGAAVSVVYATYVIFEPIFGVLLKIVSPRIMLTGSIICWSAVTIGSSFIKNYHQLIACRLLLGMFEASISPCISLYLTMTYKRDEYVRRQTAINCCSAISGAFGGLLAYALTNIHTGNMHGWQFMYLVEGLLSACIIPIAYFLVPNRPSELRFLTPEESTALLKRQIMNRKYYDDREEFSWSEIRRAFKDWRLYVHAINHFGIDCTLYSLTTFMPSLCSSLGFTTTIQSQLLTVPVYAIAATAFVICGWLSDRWNLRSPFILQALGWNLIGYIILIAAPQPGVRYAGIFISSIGLYVATALNNLWAADNIAGHYKRAVSCGTIQLTGTEDISGAIIGFIFTSQTAPRYRQGIYFDIAATLMSMGCTIILLLGTRAKISKKAKQVAAGAPDDNSLGDENPHYKLFM
ncbi:hypothetical protein IAT38_004228 [Cryptococcus sp. DSM 104549]